MKIVYCSIVVVLVLATTAGFAQFTPKPIYEIEVRQADTLMGKISVEMFPALAPNHVRNWDSLVAIKFYDTVAFHRVIAEFMIQGGDPNSKNGPMNTWGTGGSGTKLKAEFNAVSHQPGILSAARASDPNSATSQFFICVADDSYLDLQYTVYGQVVSGLDVAMRISEVLTDAADHPVDKVTMFITKTGLNEAETAIPEQVFPLHDANLADTTKSVTFRWHRVPDAMIYKLQVARDADFTDLYREVSVSQMDTSARMGGFQKQRAYYWRLLANNGGRPSEYSAPWMFSIGTLSVADDSQSNIAFDEIIPHPVATQSTIRFTLHEQAKVSMSLLDILGNTVRPITNQEQRPAGINEISLDATNLPAGVYLLLLEANGQKITRRLIVE